MTLVFILNLLLACWALTVAAQTPPQAPAREKTAPGVSQQPASQQATSRQAASQQATAQQAKELFQSVDEILTFASEDSGLAIKSPVKRQIANREQVERYVEKQLEEDQDAKRFERSELIIKKFGLLPRDFQLRPVLVRLLKEQVAGYYDARSKTVNLLDWISADAQKPVMAHELTHALQDQQVDLRKWLGDTAAGAPKPSTENEEVAEDERSGARNAVVEGQGMAVLMDYMLRPLERNILDSPHFVEAMIMAMDAAEPKSELASAPMMLRDSLLFPYRDGLRFVAALLKHGGKQQAFAAALARPPANTHEIMEPGEYLHPSALPPLSMPDWRSALGADYDKYDVGSVGAFDVRLLCKQFADVALAAKLAAAWRGGLYLAVAPKGKTATGTGDIAVLYLSRWRSAEEAARFAEFYSSTITRRYPGATQKNGTQNNGPLKNRAWNTSEGPATVEAVQDSVLVLEGFEPAAAAKLRQAALESLSLTPNPSPAAAAHPQSRNTSEPIPSSDLSLRLVAPLAAQWAPFHRWEPLPR